ncbi:3588_t:CDS:1, partial [Racocetra fulgida]
GIVKILTAIADLIKASKSNLINSIAKNTVSPNISSNKNMSNNITLENLSV